MGNYFRTAPQVLDPVETRSELKCDKLETSISRLVEIVEAPVNLPRYATCHTSIVATGKEGFAPETSISRLVEIVEAPVKLPRYATCHTSIVATGKEGFAPGELNNPRGVAIHEDTHQIFVVNQWVERVEIFSEMGEFLYQLGVEQLFEPFGIAIHGDSVFVSCQGDHTVSKFSLTEMCHVRRIGGEGSNNGQFYNPSQLTTDSIGCVFIADTCNNRICIHDPDLDHLRNITHQSISGPEDVKVLRDRLYVLCPCDHLCMHILTLEGDKLHSLITHGRGTDISQPSFFCLDPLGNFVISDKTCGIVCDIGYYSRICVFSPKGNRLRTIGTEGQKQGMFFKPRGVALTPNGRLVCVSENKKYGLQIFY